MEAAWGGFGGGGNERWQDGRREEGKERGRAARKEGQREGERVIGNETHRRSPATRTQKKTDSIYGWTYFPDLRKFTQLSDITARLKAEMMKADTDSHN